MTGIARRLERLEAQTGTGTAATPDERAELWRLMDSDDKAALADLDALTQRVEARCGSIPAGERWRIWSDRRHEDCLEALG